MSPELPSTNTGVETELSDSFGQENDKNNEGKETSIIDDCGPNECQEGLDGIPEEQLPNASDWPVSKWKDKPSWEPLFKTSLVGS